MYFLVAKFWAIDIGQLAGQYYAVIIAVVAVVATLVVYRILRRSRSGPDVAAVDLSIDVDSLPTGGPGDEGPRLEFYNVPVRLAVLVLAPSGRTGTLPPVDKLPEMVDAIVPGLLAVFESHKPLVRRWPGQLSSQGFAHAYFNNVRLPGDGGKGSPWCSVAGRADYLGQKLLVGMTFRTDAPNSLAQLSLDNERQWLDVLRIRPVG